jgi:hypothetical protein
MSIGSSFITIVLRDIYTGPEKDKKATFSPFGLFKHLNANEVPSSYPV